MQERSQGTEDLLGFWDNEIIEYSGWARNQCRIQFNLSKWMDGRVGRERHKLLFGEWSEMMGWSQFKIHCIWDTSETYKK